MGQNTWECLLSKIHRNESCPFRPGSDARAGGSLSFMFPPSHLCDLLFLMNFEVRVAIEYIEAVSEEEVTDKSLHPNPDALSSSSEIVTQGLLLWGRTQRELGGVPDCLDGSSLEHK